MASPSVVLTNESSMALSPDHLHEVAQALQTQVVRDFRPAWHVDASVTVAGASDLPGYAWVIRIVDDSPLLGVHSDPNGRPSARVRAAEGWTVTASHELLEMLVDPQGDRVEAGTDIDPDHHRRRV